MKEIREAYIDNFKAILIFLVVYGHMLEKVSFKGSQIIYIIIYSFHMPAFAFLSGICFKKNTNWITKFLVPYIICQTIYIIYYSFEENKLLELQYTTPIWILWYLLALIIWYILAEMLLKSEYNDLIVIGISFFIALLVGYESTIGEYLSLSRVLVIFPFFLCGIYIKQKYYQEFKIFISMEYKIVKIIINILLVFGVGIMFWKRKIMTAAWFYHMYPYKYASYSIFVRTGIFFVAMIIILVILFYIPKEEIPIITRIGRNTFQVFVLHGIIINFISHRDILFYTNYRGEITLLLSVMIVFMLSIELVKHMFYFIIMRN